MASAHWVCRDHEVINYNTVATQGFPDLREIEHLSGLEIKMLFSQSGGRGFKTNRGTCLQKTDMVKYYSIDENGGEGDIHLRPQFLH